MNIVATAGAIFGRIVIAINAKFLALAARDLHDDRHKVVWDAVWIFAEESEYSCAMKSHFRKFGNQMSGSGNHLCNYANLLA